MSLQQLVHRRDNHSGCVICKVSQQPLPNTPKSSSNGLMLSQKLLYTLSMVHCQKWPYMETDSSSKFDTVLIELRLRWAVLIGSNLTTCVNGTITTSSSDESETLVQEVSGGKSSKKVKRMKDPRWFVWINEIPLFERFCYSCVGLLAYSSESVWMKVLLEFLVSELVILDAGKQVTTILDYRFFLTFHPYPPKFQRKKLFRLQSWRTSWEKFIICMRNWNIPLTNTFSCSL